MRNSEIESWVADVAGHTKPGAIHWCDGSKEEGDELTKRMLANGTLESWLAEVEQNEGHLTRFQDRLPTALWDEHRSLRDRLRASIS